MKLLTKNMSCITCQLFDIYVNCLACLSYVSFSILEIYSCWDCFSFGNSFKYERETAFITGFKHSQWNHFFCFWIKFKISLSEETNKGDEHPSDASYSAKQVIYSVHRILSILSTTLFLHTHFSMKLFRPFHIYISLTWKKKIRFIKRRLHTPNSILSQFHNSQVRVYNQSWRRTFVRSVLHPTNIF